MLYPMRRYGKKTFKKRSGLRSAKKFARKKVDKAQNNTITKLQRQVKNLTKATIEYKYLVSKDSFSIGGDGATKSRLLSRFHAGTYTGMTSEHIFGTSVVNGDTCFWRYFVLDVSITINNPTEALQDEFDPTNFNIFILKAKHGGQDQIGLENTNAFNNSNMITTYPEGQAFVNPQGWKVIKHRYGTLGGTPGHAGIATRRYRFKVPVNKSVKLQRAGFGDNLEPYPTNYKDWYYFVITSNGSWIDNQAPHCTISLLNAVSDSGDN